MHRSNAKELSTEAIAEYGSYADDCTAVLSPEEEKLVLSEDR